MEFKLFKWSKRWYCIVDWIYFSYLLKVFCAACCSLKCKLLYMDRKEARVCVICHSVLMNGKYQGSSTDFLLEKPIQMLEIIVCFSSFCHWENYFHSDNWCCPMPVVHVQKHPGTFYFLDHHRILCSPSGFLLSLIYRRKLGSPVLMGECNWF